MTGSADRFDDVLESGLDLTADRTPLSRNPLFAFLDRQQELLTPERELVLARAARAGCARSRRELVERNLMLVLKLVEDTSPPDEHDRLDRIQAGAIGLMRAVDRFDPAKFNRLSTYATWWIRQAITRERDKRELHSGVSADLAREIRTNERIWWNEHGREPTDRQLAEFASLDVDEVARARASLRPYSLDKPIKPGGDSMLGDLVTDDAACDPANLVELIDLRQQIAEHLRHLDEDSRSVVRLRFGIDNAKPESLTRIAASTNRSLDQTRALTAKAIRTLQRRMSPPPTTPRPDDLTWPDRCRTAARQGHELIDARRPRCSYPTPSQEATA